MIGGQPKYSIEVFPVSNHTSTLLDPSRIILFFTLVSFQVTPQISAVQGPSSVAHFFCFEEFSTAIPTRLFMLPMESKPEFYHSETLYIYIVKLIKKELSDTAHDPSGINFHSVDSAFVKTVCAKCMQYVQYDKVY